MCEFGIYKWEVWFAKIRVGIHHLPLKLRLGFFRNHELKTWN